jgi:hypothetical protein
MCCAALRCDVLCCPVLSCYELLTMAVQKHSRALPHLMHSSCCDVLCSTLLCRAVLCCAVLC